MFQYIPMPKVSYPELETELFCSIYYLRHLCDTAKFPNWPIKAPVRGTLFFFFFFCGFVLSLLTCVCFVFFFFFQIELLKDVLDEWKREVDKKPSNMSFDEALKILNIDKRMNKRTASSYIYFISETSTNASSVRKVYYVLANKYHPDKNPDGREMFEAYVFTITFLGS